MPVAVEAEHENGLLKPGEPPRGKGGERVRATVSGLDGPLLRAYGILGFRGTAEQAEYLTAHADLLPEEAR